MTKSLIIAEKPSVAQDIVRALTPTSGKFEKFAEHFENERYVVTSAVGHLVEIKAPFNPDVATKDIAIVLKSYGLSKTTADHYAAQWVVSAFAWM